MRRALAANPGAARVDFVAHSAGGWLGRAYIGGALNEVDWSKRRKNGGGAAAAATTTIAKVPVPHPSVRRLVTLGSPHIAPPAGANDPTRGALRWVNERWPGARFSKDDDGDEAAAAAEAGVRYACVTGRTVRGKAGSDAKGTLAGYACNSYVQVCGRGDAVEGDAVVPNDFAVLDGADNTIIDGVFHSMAGTGTGAWGEPGGVGVGIKSTQSPVI